MKNKLLMEMLGWGGATVLIAAYLLNSFSYVKSDSLLYQGANFAGSIIIAYYTFVKKAYPNTVLNLIWMVIALVSIIAIILK